MTIENLKMAVQNMNAYLEECHDESDTITLTAKVLKSIKENYEELIKLKECTHRVEASQFGGIESITPKEIELTKEQCAEIGNHLLTGIVMRDMYNGQPKINQWDSEIILNYIEKGYSFMSSYKLVKSQSWCDCGAPQNDEVR